VKKQFLNAVLLKFIKLLPDYWKYICVLYYRNLMGYKPIIIYQMGKVGSTTIYQTIKYNLKNPVFHVHFLSATKISLIRKRYQSAGVDSNPLHIRESIFLEGFYWKDSFLKWNIITLVRDPITAKLSHMFHNPRVHHTYLFDENGNLDKERALQITYDRLMNFNVKTDYVCNWINDELNNFLKIDLYSCPFDKILGYGVLKSKKNNVLVMQMESINNCFNNSLIEMGLTKNNLNIRRVNENIEKEFSLLYKFVKDNLKLPSSKVREIYSSKYAQHFYSSEYIERQIERWS